MSHKTRKSKRGMKNQQKRETVYFMVWEPIEVQIHTGDTDTDCGWGWIGHRVRVWRLLQLSIPSL